MKTTHPQSCGPSEILVENKGTPLNMKGDPNVSEGDTQMEYFADYLCSPNRGAVTKIACKNLDQYMCRCIILYI